MASVETLGALERRLNASIPQQKERTEVESRLKRIGRTAQDHGFRPGKAPRAGLGRMLGPGAVLDDAVEHLVQDAYRAAIEQEAILPLANAEVEIVQAEEGKPVIFKATVPVRPDVQLGDYRGFSFGPEIEPTDDPRVDKAIEELRDEYATLAAVEDRAAAKGDWAVIAYQGTRDGEPFEGGSTERMPLVIGDDRLIPGFEDHLIGLRVGEGTEFDITFPEDYGEPSLAGANAHFAVQLRELRERILPELDDAFAGSLGDNGLAEIVALGLRWSAGRNQKLALLFGFYALGHDADAEFARQCDHDADHLGARHLLVGGHWYAHPHQRLVQRIGWLAGGVILKAIHLRLDASDLLIGHPQHHRV